MIFRNRGLIVLLLALLFVVIFSQISISLDINEQLIPVTGQSFAVLLVAYLLKSKKATVVILLYLLAGAAGLPVFADATSGVEKLTGTSGGYLYGFLLASWITGKLGEQKQANKMYFAGLSMTLGTVVILTVGLFHLHFFVGWEKAFVYGLYPFIAGAIIKIIVGTVLAFLHGKYGGKYIQ